MEHPVRKNVRLEGWDYSSEGYYYLTICAKDMQCVFGDIFVRDGVHDVPRVALSPIGMVVENRLMEMERVYPEIRIDKYCIMPNHLHLIVALTYGASRTPPRTNGGRANQRIPAFVSTLKRMTNRECGQTLWHRSYYDHIIRNETDYQRIWQYIDTNPARWQTDDYYKG